MTEFLEAPDLIPSQESSKTSIVYGKITQTSLANDLEHFSEVRIFLLTKISDICSHLSLGARPTGTASPGYTRQADFVAAGLAIPVAAADLAIAAVWL